MAESQVLGLFANPQLVEQQVRREIRESAPEFISQANRRLFSNIAEIGAPFDPRVTMARQAQSVVQSTPGDMSKSAYFRSLADKFRKQGMSQASFAAMQRAQELEQQELDNQLAKDKLDIERQKAEAKKKSDAITAKFGTISPKDYGSYTPAIAAGVQEYFSTQDLAERQRLDSEIRSNMRAGAAEVRGSAVTEAREKAEAEAEAKEDVRREAGYRTQLEEDYASANDYAATVYDIQENLIEAVQAGQVITGPFADWRASAYALMRTVFPQFGGEELGRKLANTQSAANLIGDQLLANIKKLGTNPSNADREFIQAMLPQINQSPEAMEKIANFMAEKAKYAFIELEARKKYLDDNGDLEGYIAPKAQAFLEQLYTGEGIDTSTENQAPNASISRANVRVPPQMSDLTQTQVNKYSYLLSQKGGLKGSLDFLVAKGIDKLTDDEVAILDFIDQQLTSGAQ